MCLSRVTKNRFPKGTSGTGYIVCKMTREKDVYRTPVYAAPVVIGVEYTDTIKQRAHVEWWEYNHLGIARTYRVGFHIFKNVEHAVMYAHRQYIYYFTILKVEWSEPLAEGRQGSFDVVVARKRKAVKEVYRVDRHSVTDNIQR